jgi:hypothetical protein
MYVGCIRMHSEIFRCLFLLSHDVLVPLLYSNIVLGKYLVRYFLHSLYQI